VGLNVTVPHKVAVLELCTPDEEARVVGAVNTLVFGERGISGHNTDVHGFRSLLAEAGGRDDGRVVLLGAGGAARAVAAALCGRAKEITIVSRRTQPIQIAGRELAGAAWEPSVLERLLGEADLLVDTTPRGLDSQAPAIDLSPMHPNAVVLDLVVRRDTALTRAARARGLRAATGASMLLHQGARSLEIWTGKTAPLEVMRAALDDALAAHVS
jgi:shikimate dehydrogenase